MTDEDILLAEWRAGNTQSGEMLFSSLLGPLQRFFANKVRQPEHAEDLVGATFEILLERPSSSGRGSQFRAYMFGIARNLLRAYYRKHCRDGSTVDVEELAITEMGASPFSYLADSQSHKVLLQGLRRIPLNQQIVLELYFWEKMRGPEIAALLDLPLATVHSRKRSGKARLQREIERILRTPGRMETSIHDIGDWVREVRGIIGYSTGVQKGRG